MPSMRSTQAIRGLNGYQWAALMLKRGVIAMVLIVLTLTTTTTTTTIKSKGNSMTTTKTNTKTTYGLKASTVSLYSEAVKMGYSWSLAMSKLKELYEHN